MTGPERSPPSENPFGKAVDELGALKEKIAAHATPELIHQAGEKIEAAKQYVTHASREKWQELQSHINAIRQSAEGTIDTFQVEVGNRILDLENDARTRMAHLFAVTGEYAASTPEGITDMLSKGMEKVNDLMKSVTDAAASIGSDGLNGIADLLATMGFATAANIVRSFAESPSLTVRALYDVLERDTSLHFRRTDNDATLLEDITTVYQGIEFNKAQIRKQPHPPATAAPATQEQFFETLRAKLSETAGTRTATTVNDALLAAREYEKEFPLPSASVTPATTPAAAPSTAPNETKNLLDTHATIENHDVLVDGPRGIILLDNRIRWKLEGRKGLLKLPIEIVEAEAHSDGRLQLKAKHPVDGSIIEKNIPKADVKTAMEYLADASNTEYPLPNQDDSGNALPPNAFFVKLS